HRGPRRRPHHHLRRRSRQALAEGVPHPGRLNCKNREPTNGPLAGLCLLKPPSLEGAIFTNRRGLHLPEPAPDAARLLEWAEGIEHRGPRPGMEEVVAERADPGALV